MSTQSRGYRTAARCALLAAGLGLTAACTTPPAPVTIDLIHELSHAERRARGNVDEAIHADGGALVLQSPARVTWVVRLPRPATFETRLTWAAPSPDAARGVVLRLGVATPRQYRDVARVNVNPDAAPTSVGSGADGIVGQVVTIDLGSYSGRAWSLFYHPDQIAWKLILNADALPGGTIVLTQPRVEMR